MAETWVFNNVVDAFEYGTYLDSENVALTEVTPFWVSYDGTFISNGITYNGFLFGKNSGFTPPITGSGADVYNNSSNWIGEAYRTITFEEAPTGDFLTWLQANGTLTPSSSPSTAEKLQELLDIKQDIKDAIENKGVDLTDVAFSGYAEKIDEIPLPKEEQEAIVDGFIFQSGDVVVTPSTGKVLTKVTVVKDIDLVPENIVKNVNIFGVVGTSAIAVELTQAQYDALVVYDNNTYYLIVEE